MTVTFPASESPPEQEPDSGWSQTSVRVGILDLGPGLLHRSLLPTAVISRCLAEAVERWGPDILSYGPNAGPKVLRAELARRMVETGSAAQCSPEHVATTAGISAALDQLAWRLGGQHGTLITEALTYDLGKKIFAARGVRLVSLPGALGEIDLRELQRLISDNARGRSGPVALYLIPTYHNPTGRVLPESLRREILEITREMNVLVIEDCAYWGLNYSDAPPPALWSLATDRDQVVALYSFSKFLAPGLRLGWIVSGERTISKIGEDALRASGGGPTHLIAAIVAAGYLGGRIDSHVANLRQELGERRDMLVGTLRERMPSRFVVQDPPGGFFAWIQTPPETNEHELLAEAEARGVSFAVGSRFGHAARGVRLCFASQGLADLAVGADRFARASAAVL